MKTKEEIKQWLLENCLDKDGDLDLSNLDFSDFNGNVLLFNMKVQKDLLQNNQQVGRDLRQDSQQVGRDLYQSYQEVQRGLYQHSQNIEGNLWQSDQKVKGDLYQDDQKVDGKIHQDTLTTIEIDNQIKALKKVISLLEKQKVNEEESEDGK